MEEQNKTNEQKDMSSMNTEEHKMNQSHDNSSSMQQKSNDGAPDAKWLFYILAILFPVIGIIIGIIYMKKDNEEAKKFGKTTLMISIAVLLIQCLCSIAFFFFGSSLGAITTSYDYSTY